MLQIRTRRPDGPPRHTSLFALALVALVAGCGGDSSTGGAPANRADAGGTGPDRGMADTSRTDLPRLPPDTIDGRPDDAGSDAADTQPQPKAPEYPLTEKPYTTLQRVWAPLDPSDETRNDILTGDLEITDIDEYRAHGLGVEPLEGRPWTEKDGLAPNYPSDTARDRESLLYFWQSADPQLIDEESPIRFEGVTSAPVGSTYRPQDHLTTQVYEAHVRTARRISEESGRPFEFALVTGDFTDGGQKNEAQWAFQILNGGVIHPDSGVDNDPVPGEANDFTDKFWSRGIGVPWYTAIGNHETLYVGSLPATDEVKRAAVGNEVYEFTGKIPGVGLIEGLQNGYRDASTKTAEVVREGTTPADPDREILPLDELLEMIRTTGGRPDGHGLTKEAASAGKGYYSFHPASGKPIRVVVLNTLMDDPVNVSGGMDEAQFDWLKSELEEAKRAGELVIVAGHHRTGSFTFLSPVDGDDVQNLLAGYSNVLLYLVGHGHSNATKRVDGRDGATGYWELMCASTVDFPLQTRILELVYDGDGYLSVYVTNVGHNSPRGTPGHRARHFAAARKLFLKGEVRDDFRDQIKGSNLLLRYKLPDELASSIESTSWPDRIESTQTLKQFPEPAY